MGHSQIAAFARLANGNVKPTRTIFGQNTKITRNIHGFAYDPVKDEIVVPQFHSQAIMTFRGGANGDEAPIRIIHGPDVKIANTDKVTIDPIHRETYVPVIGAVMVFNSDADGNVPPIRVLKGPNTQIPPKGSLPTSAVPDPIHDLVFIGRSIFNRTDSGDVKPRGFLRHGAGYLSPEGGGLFFSTLRSGRGNRANGAAEAAANPGFVENENYNQYSEDASVGVWMATDTGETEPRWVIAAPPNGPLRDPVGTVAVDAKHQDVYIPDRYTNSIYIYHVPEIFR